jgi:hypothetical protein
VAVSTKLKRLKVKKHGRMRNDEEVLADGLEWILGEEDECDERGQEVREEEEEEERATQQRREYLPES